MSKKETVNRTEVTKIDVPPPTPQELALLEQQTKIAEATAKNIQLTGALFAQQVKAIQPLLDLAAEEARIRGEVLTPEIQTQILQNEVALQQANVDLLRTQLENDIALEPARREFLTNQLNAAQADLDRDQALSPLREEALRTQFDILQKGGVPTPEQMAFLDEEARRAIEVGSSDIRAFAEESLRLLREELAPSLGLRPGDTPILDRGQLVAREAVRQFGQLESTVQGSKAAAQTGLIGQNLATAGQVTGLEATLADQAQKNRIALSASLDPNAQPTSVGALLGQSGQDIAQTFGLGVSASGINTGAAQTLTGLEQLRLGSATRTGTINQVTKTSDPFGSFASILGGAGGLFTGLSDIGVGGG